MKDPDSPWNARLPALFFIALTAIFCYAVGHAGAAIVAPYGQPEAIREVPIPRGLDKVATDFWAERGVGVPPRVSLIEMVPEAEAAARAWGPPNHPATIWISAEYLYQYDPRRLCMLYIHERGHTAGLQHDAPYWIMWPGQVWTHAIPPRCEKWWRE